MSERKNHLGFTLVELMVVIAIIWVLAAALFPAMSQYQMRARDTTRNQDLNKIGLALEAYHIDTSRVPWNGTDLSTTTDCTNFSPTCRDPWCWGEWDSGNMKIDPTDSFLAPLMTGGYMSSVPREQYLNEVLPWSAAVVWWQRCTYRYLLDNYGVWNYGALVIRPENVKPLSRDIKPYYVNPWWWEGSTGSTELVYFILE